MSLSLAEIEFSPFKCLVYFDRIKNLAEGKEVFPVTLELDVSSYCNHHCKWCVDPEGSHTNVLMAVKAAEKILHEAAELDVKGVVFKGGGESTLHPGLDRIMATAAGLGFETGLVTNGTGLDNRNLRDVLIGTSSYVRVSIDGPDRESHEAIHGSHDFDKIIAGVRNLVGARNNRRHPVIGATFCMEYSNRHLIHECIKIGNALQLDYILIRPPFCEEVGYACVDTPQQLKTLRKEIFEAAEHHEAGMTVFAGNWIGDREMLLTEKNVKAKNELGRRDLSIKTHSCNGIEHITRRCRASALSVVVTAEQEVFGCCCLRNIPQFSFGQINYDNGITLRDVLSGQQRKRSLEKMRKANCLDHCTHPFSKVNEMIDYLSLPNKYHSSFL